MSAKKDNLPLNPEPIIQDGGSITYANEVIAIISGIAASEIEGVAGMVTAGGIGEIISKNRNITRGVKVEVGKEEVSVDLYTIVEFGQPIQKVASEVQENVRKSIESMTGLKVVRVDIHVQGVSFEQDKKETQNRLEAANVPHLTAAKPDKKAKKEEVKKEEPVTETPKAEKPTPEEAAPTKEEAVAKEAPATDPDEKAEPQEPLDDAKKETAKAAPSTAKPRAAAKPKATSAPRKPKA